MPWIKSLFVYVVLVLVPLVPVLVIYDLYGEQNYFGLDQWVKGMVATGPIAAYVFLLWLNWKIITAIARDFGQPLSDGLEVPDGLLGDWRYISSTSNDTERKGRCTISVVGSRLILHGSYRNEQDEYYGDWESSLAGVEAGYLYFVYDIDKVLARGVGPRKGICTVSLDNLQHGKLDGIWGAIDQQEIKGKITLSKEK
jgi:hypothetical protein